MDILSTPTPNTISQDSQINKPEVQLTQGQAREPKKTIFSFYNNNYFNSA